MTFLLALGDGLGCDFAKGKITGTLFMKVFLPPSKCRVTYPVSSARGEIFPRYFVQPAFPQILFFWETIE